LILSTIITINFLIFLFFIQFLFDSITGAASNGLILNNYSTKDAVASLCRIAVAISVTFSFPLIFVGTRDGLLDMFKVKQSGRTYGLLNKITIGLIFAITALASQLTDLGLVASIGGATFGTALVYVYPIIMFLKLQNGKRTKETLPAALIGILGVAMGAIGTVFACKGL
jgi:Transmembrane amino acid transporter protein